jgi:hypothetical protein
MIVKTTVQNRVRPYETVYTTVFEVHSTSEPNRAKIVYKSFETVQKSYIQHPINIRMSHDHGTIHSSAHTVSYDRHTNNTVQVRIIHGRHGLVRVYTI